MNRPSVHKDNLDQFKEHYEKAVENNEQEFQFEGAQVLTQYAKYLIEFIETLNPQSEE